MFSGSGDAGAAGPSVAYYELIRLYDHKLERSAFNMCCGPFGAVSGMWLV